MKSSGCLHRLAEQGQLLCKAGIPESHHLKSAGKGVKGEIQLKRKMYLTLNSQYINKDELFSLLFGLPIPMVLSPT